MAQTTQNKNKEILEGFADEGYHLEEEGDHVTTLWFKDDMFAAFSQVGATAQDLRDACARHRIRLNGEPSLRNCRDCTHWHYTGDWRGNCFIRRWEHDKSSQDATAIGCKEYAVRCAETVATAKEG